MADAGPTPAEREEERRLAELLERAAGPPSEELREVRAGAVGGAAHVHLPDNDPDDVVDATGGGEAKEDLCEEFLDCELQLMSASDTKAARREILAELAVSEAALQEREESLLVELQLHSAHRSATLRAHLARLGEVGDIAARESGERLLHERRRNHECEERLRQELQDSRAQAQNTEVVRRHAAEAWSVADELRQSAERLQEQARELEVEQEAQDRLCAEIAAEAKEAERRQRAALAYAADAHLALEADPSELPEFEDAGDICRNAMLLLEQSFIVLGQGRRMAKIADDAVTARKRMSDELAEARWKRDEWAQEEEAFRERSTTGFAEHDARAAAANEEKRRQAELHLKEAERAMDTMEIHLEALEADFRVREESLLGELATMRDGNPQAGPQCGDGGRRGQEEAPQRQARDGGAEDAGNAGADDAEAVRAELREAAEELAEALAAHARLEQRAQADRAEASVGTSALAEELQQAKSASSQLELRVRELSSESGADQSGAVERFALAAAEFQEARSVNAQLERRVQELCCESGAEQRDAVDRFERAEAAVTHFEQESARLQQRLHELKAESGSEQNGAVERFERAVEELQQARSANAQLQERLQALSAETAAEQSGALEGLDRAQALASLLEHERAQLEQRVQELSGASGAVQGDAVERLKRAEEELRQARSANAELEERMLALSAGRGAEENGAVERMECAEELARARGKASELEQEAEAAAARTSEELARAEASVARLEEQLRASTTESGAELQATCEELRHARGKVSELEQLMQDSAAQAEAAQSAMNGELEISRAIGAELEVRLQELASAMDADEALKKELEDWRSKHAEAERLAEDLRSKHAAAEKGRLALLEEVAQMEHRTRSEAEEFRREARKTVAEQRKVHFVEASERVHGGMLDVVWSAWKYQLAVSRAEKSAETSQAALLQVQQEHAMKVEAALAEEAERQKEMNEGFTKIQELEARLQEQLKVADELGKREAAMRLASDEDKRIWTEHRLDDERKRVELLQQHEEVEERLRHLEALHDAQETAYASDVNARKDEYVDMQKSLQLVEERERQLESVHAAHQELQEQYTQLAAEQRNLEGVHREVEERKLLLDQLRSAELAMDQAHKESQEQYNAKLGGANCVIASMGAEMARMKMRTKEKLIELHRVASMTDAFHAWRAETRLHFLDKIHAGQAEVYEQEREKLNNKLKADIVQKDAAAAMLRSELQALQASVVEQVAEAKAEEAAKGAAIQRVRELEEHEAKTAEELTQERAAKDLANKELRMAKNKLELGGMEQQERDKTLQAILDEIAKATEDMAVKHRQWVDAIIAVPDAGAPARTVWQRIRVGMMQYARSTPHEPAPQLAMGDHIAFAWNRARHTGVVRFVGEVEGRGRGDWIGVRSDRDLGAPGGGTFQGKTYFDCEEGHGWFLRPRHVIHVQTK